MEILYEDGDIIVVNKEAGLPVQAGSVTQIDLISILKNHVRQEGEENPYLGIVHRLDQPVEGLVVFAKNPEAAGSLSRQVQAKSGGHSDMRKVYQAVVILTDRAAAEKAARAEHSVVVLQNYLRRNYAGNTAEVVPEKARGAKWAELTYRTLRIRPAGKTGVPAAGEILGRALLEIHLHTGRHHQIRAQLAAAGLPIDGDRKYGPPGLYYDYNIRLCASFLQLRHPKDGRKMQFSVTPSFLENAQMQEPFRK